MQFARAASQEQGESHVTSPGAGHMEQEYCPVSGDVHTGLPCDNQHAQPELQTPFLPQPSYAQSELLKHTFGIGNPDGMFEGDK